MPIDLCGGNRTIVSQRPFDVKGKVSEAVCVFPREGRLVGSDESGKHRAT